MQQVFCRSPKMGMLPCDKGGHLVMLACLLVYCALLHERTALHCPLSFILCKLRVSMHNCPELSTHVQVLDETAFTLCKENKIPVLVFDLHRDGNIVRAVQGNPSIGTIVDSAPDQPDDIAPCIEKERGHQPHAITTRLESLAQSLLPPHHPHQHEQIYIRNHAHLSVDGAMGTAPGTAHQASGSSWSD
jgi:hypothetical protein